MRKKSIIKALAWSFLSLCIFAVLLIGLAGTNVGLRLATHIANQSEMIQIEGVNGGLFTQINIESVSFASPDSIKVDIDKLDIDLSLGCLLDARLCLTLLKVDEISVYLQASSKEKEIASEPATDIIRLPFEVFLQQLTLNRIKVYQAERGGAPNEFISINQVSLNELSAFERFDINSLSISELLLHKRPESAQLAQRPDAGDQSFNLQTLRAALSNAPTVSLPYIFIPLNAKLHKAEIKRLCWNEGQQSDPKPDTSQCVSELNTQLSVQEQVFELELSLDADRLLTTFGVDAQMLSSDVRIDLSKQLVHDLSLSLTKEAAAKESNANDALQLSMQGDLSRSDIRVKTFSQNTSLASGDIIKANVAGQWQKPQLPLNLSIELANPTDINHFLVNDIQLPLSQGTLELQGDWQGYQLSGEIVLSNQAKDLSALSTVTWDAFASPEAMTLNLRELSSSGDIGQAMVKGDVSLISEAQEPLLSSQLSVVLKSLDLGKINKELSSNLSGSFTLMHELSDNGMRGELLCQDLGGRFQTYKISLSCDASLAKNGELEIRTFGFEQGENTLNAQGVLRLPSTRYQTLTLAQLLESESDFDFSVNLNRLDELIADAQGQIAASGQLDGALRKPRVFVDATLSDINAFDVTLKQGSVSGSLDGDKGYKTDLSVNFTDVVAAGNVFERIELNLNGDAAQHQAEMELIADSFSTYHAVQGSLTLSDTARTWSGQWDEGRLSLPFTQVSLQQEVAVSADFNSQDFAVQSHCWQEDDGDGRLCIDKLSGNAGEVVGRARMAYDLSEVSQYYASQWIQPGTSLPFESEIDFTFSSKKGLQANAYNRLINGKIETTEGLITLNAIIANVELEDGVVHSAVYAGSTNSGTFGLQSHLNLSPDNRVHDGIVSIKDFQLQWLERFIPATQSLQGEVKADVRFSGPLLEPNLNGFVDLNNGELFLEDYEYPLTEFNQNLTFEGQSAQIEGSFNLGKGDATYQAALEFGSDFALQGALKGEGMQVSYDNSIAQVSPDLNFAMSSTDLRLSGDVRIPSAEIVIKELPESARTPTEDTIILGEPEPEPAIPLALDIDLNIIIDEAKRGFVMINALDLEATLAGRLALALTQTRRNDNSLRPMTSSLNGEVNILDGSYEAYGQMLLVQSGKILFSGEPTLPEFNVRAIRNPLNTQGDVIAGVQITGNPVLPRVELFSEPAMIQARQLSYLLQGQDFSSDGGDSVGTDTTLINMLVNFGVGRSENGVGRFGRAVGFDSLNVGTAGTGNNTQVQVTGRISDDIQISYGVGLFDSASVVSLKYQLMPKLYIEAKSGINSSVDLFYQMTRGENE